MIERWLLLGDCLDIMPGLAAGSVDMVLADLPYGTTACKWDSVIPFEPLWREYRRVCKPTAAIVLTASQPFTSALVMSNPGWFRHEWVWEKDGGSNFLNTPREPMKEHESIAVFSRGDWTFNKQMQERIGSRRGKITKSSGRSHSMCYGQFSNAEFEVAALRGPRSIQRVSRERGLHPTQKPVALMEYLIRTYTNEGDTVLDNTMGSGTTGVACATLGRKFIGIEISCEYFQIAEDRIRKASEQTNLFIGDAA